MKKRLNIFCVCMIAAFLLSVSGNVYLIIEMFVNGVEVGMKAAQGEITEIPQYKMVHVLPTDMMETTGTVTNRNVCKRSRGRHESCTRRNH